MNSLYYTVELLIIAAVLFLNSLGIRISYFNIIVIFVVHFVQLLFHLIMQNNQTFQFKNMYNQIEKLQKSQKDIISKQKDLKDDLMFGGYN